MKKLIYLTAMMILLIGFIGCKKTEEASSSGPDLDGTWSSSCFTDGTEGHKADLIFSGFNVTQKDYNYGDGNTGRARD